MAEEASGEEVQVPVVWVGVEEAPILYANAFISQFDLKEGFIITAGQMTPPPLTGTPEEILEKAKELSYVPVRVAARLALTHTQMIELAQSLQANLEQFEEGRKMRGDPRDE
ncbi:MAG TPA: hypothetical protein VES61_01060 [Gaiellaceae bacterium]|nr:hypothetical protein [Gaiellaceae bacterium]